jgi:hypothetical protein
VGPRPDAVRGARETFHEMSMVLFDSVSVTWRTILLTLLCMAAPRTDFDRGFVAVHITRRFIKLARARNKRGNLGVWVFPAIYFRMNYTRRFQSQKPKNPRARSEVIVTNL